MPLLLFLVLDIRTSFIIGGMGVRGIKGLFFSVDSDL